MNENRKRRAQILQDRLRQALLDAKVKLNTLRSGIEGALVPELDRIREVLEESVEILRSLEAEQAPDNKKMAPPAQQARTAEAAGSHFDHSPSPAGASPIQVMLVDDHAVMRQGLSELLSDFPDIRVTGEAADGEEAVQMAREIDPDVILMDISMPGMNGIEATRIIHGERPAIRIIGLSMFDAAEQAAALEQAGATDYLRKSGDKDQLIDAIRRAKGATSFHS